MCGIIPEAHCAPTSVRISWIARGTENWAKPMATKAASQLHMCG